jgi:hypothetical protein
MSSQPGNAKKSGQRYKNTIAFKVDKYGTTPAQERIKAAPTYGMCPR